MLARPMRWVAKAAVQRGSCRPASGRAGQPIVFQRHVLRSLPAGRVRVPTQVRAARSSTVRAYEEHGPERTPSDAVFYEFGAGWDLAIPLSYAALGVGRQVLVDIRPSVRVELVNDSLMAFERLWGELEAEAGEKGAPPRRSDRLDGRARAAVSGSPISRRATLGRPGCPPSRSTSSPAPTPASTSPQDDLAEIFRESFRLLRPGGAFSCRIDLQDHYSYFDPTASRATTSCATPTVPGAWSARRSTIRTGSARRTTSGSFARPASSSSPNGRRGRATRGWRSSSRSRWQRGSGATRRRSSASRSSPSWRAGLERPRGDADKALMARGVSILSLLVALLVAGCVAHCAATERTERSHGLAGGRPGAAGRVRPHVPAGRGAAGAVPRPERHLCRRLDRRLRRHPRARGRFVVLRPDRLVGVDDAPRGTGRHRCRRALLSYQMLRSSSVISAGLAGRGFA